MKIETNAFSFEESLKYLDELAFQINDGKPIPVCNTLTNEDLLPKTVMAVNCTVMSIMINNKKLKEGKTKEYAFHAVMRLIMRILENSKTIRHLHLQADGGLLAMFDTPMKKDVEEIINQSAQVRSINEVVLKKFHLDIPIQTVTVGIDYGPVTCYSEGTSLDEYFFAGRSIMTAKQLSGIREDCVNISDNIYINLIEERIKQLFANHDSTDGFKYYFAPLINIGMRKWVEDH